MKGRPSPIFDYPLRPRKDTRTYWAGTDADLWLYYQDDTDHNRLLRKRHNTEWYLPWDERFKAKIKRQRF